MCYFEPNYLKYGLWEKCLPIFCLQFLQIMTDFARFKNQKKNIPSAKLCLQFGAVSILPCLLEPLDSCWEYILPYVQVQVVYCHSFDLDHGGGSAHSTELKLLGFGQSFQTRADSENFSALVFFQIWDTISSPCFYKVSASNHTVCNPMGTTLKGICKGQHSQYMTLLNGQVCVASSNSFLQKLTAGLFLTLKPNCILLNLFSFLWTC